MEQVRIALALLRVGQWLKNGFIFLPAFFAGLAFDLDVIFRVALGAALYSLVASAVYLVNDVHDAEADRQHPRKSRRPIASGAVKPGTAIALAIILGISALAGAFALDIGFGIVASVYLVMNLLYSYFLKRWAILDVMIIALGFVLRILAGGELVSVEPSMWIEILTFLLALFIALGKRRDDVLVASTGVEMKRNVRGYNMEMINASMAIIASVTVVSYIMYTISPEVMERTGSQHLFYTGFFVLMGLMRYIQLALVKHRTGSPTRLAYEDWPLQVIIVAWVASFAAIIYIP